MTRRSRRDGTRTGRGISFTGFGLLFICFFLPQIKACNMPIVPADEAFGSEFFDPQINMLATLLLPFVMALVMAIFYLLRAALRPARIRRILTGTICVLALLTMLYAVVGPAAAYVDDNWNRWTDPDTPEWNTQDTTFLAIVLPAMAIAALTTVLVIRARRSVRTPAAVGCLGGVFLAYFLLIALFEPPTLYGIWVSVTASGLIAVGGFWEALAARRR